MLLNPGDTVLVAHRRLFEGDGHLALRSATGYTMNLAEFTHGGR